MLPAGSCFKVLKHRLHELRDKRNQHTEAEMKTGLKVFIFSNKFKTCLKGAIRHLYTFSIFLKSLNLSLQQGTP